MGFRKTNRMSAHSISRQAGSLMIIGLLGVGTCVYAQQSSPGVATQPALPTATPTAPSATSTPTASTATSAPQGQQTTSNRPSPETIKEARRAGYTMKTNSGNYYFCKEETDLGSRFSSEHCFQADALELLLQRQQMDKDALRSAAQGLGAH